MTYYQIIQDRCIHLLILLWIVVLFIDGYALENTTIDRIETSYYVIILFLLLIRLITVPINRSVISYILIALSTVLIGILLTEPSIQRLVDDLRYLIRSLIVGILVFWFYSTTTCISYHKIRALFIVYWLSITGFVLLHYFFHIGGVTGGAGQLKPIYTSFFKEGNMVAFAYLLAWFHLFATSNSYIIRILGTAVSLFLSSLMSSKALSLMIILLILLKWAYYFSRYSLFNKYFTFTWLIVLSTSLALYFSEIINFINYFFMQISPDSDQILYKIDTQDPLTVLFSTRDIKTQILWSEMQNRFLFTWLFGLGATEAINEVTLIEIDPFDIFKFYGLLGILIYAIALLKIGKILYQSSALKIHATDFYIFFMGALISSLVVSSLTGHILTTSGGMILLGMIFGVLASKRLQQDMLQFQNQKSIIKRSNCPKF